MRDSIVFYRSFYEAIRSLPAEDFKAAVQAIMEYGLNGREPETDGIERTIFLLVKPQIDANNRKWQNGKKGGRPVKPEIEFEEPRNNQTETNQKPPNNQTETKPEPNVNVNVNVNENVNAKENYSVCFEELWKAYPRKKEKAAAYAKYKARLHDGFSEDELMTAVKRYAEEINVLGTEERYIKHGATFFGANTPFEDYLKESYKPPKGRADTSQKQKTHFHNFEERENDYESAIWKEIREKNAAKKGESHDE